MKKPTRVLDVTEFKVASWSPGEEGTNIPPTQVHVVMTVPHLGTLVLRLKSKKVFQSLVGALIDHGGDVFGEEPKC